MFTVGISQGVYPGDDNKLPVKDMAIPKYLTLPSLYEEKKEGAGGDKPSLPTVNDDQKLVKVAFLTVPRNQLRKFMEKHAAERRLAKKKPAYTDVLASGLIIQSHKEDTIV